MRSCVYIAIYDINNLTNIKLRLNKNSTFVAVTDLLTVQRYHSIAHVHNTSEVAVIFLTDSSFLIIVMM